MLKQTKLNKLNEVVSKWKPVCQHQEVNAMEQRRKKRKRKHWHKKCQKITKQANKQVNEEKQKTENKTSKTMEEKMEDGNKWPKNKHEQ